MCDNRDAMSFSLTNFYLLIWNVLCTHLNHHYIDFFHSFFISRSSSFSFTPFSVKLCCSILFKAHSTFSNHFCSHFEINIYSFFLTKYFTPVIFCLCWISSNNLRKRYWKKNCPPKKSSFFNVNGEKITSVRFNLNMFQYHKNANRKKLEAINNGWMWPLIGLVNEMNRIMDSLDSVSQCCGSFFFGFLFTRLVWDRVLLKCKHSSVY